MALPALQAPTALIDISFNAPFKVVVNRLATKHMQENLQDSIPAGY